MASRAFNKCLMTHLTHGMDRVAYILPYDGNLTASKFEELATRLHKAVAHLYHAKAYPEPKQFLDRLKSTWLTGREPFIQIEPDGRGTFTLKGENWFFYGWPSNHFSVLEAS